MPPDSLSLRQWRRSCRKQINAQRCKVPRRSLKISFCNLRPDRITQMASGRSARFGSDWRATARRVAVAGSMETARGILSALAQPAGA
ncbi:hypothetical protein KCP69_05585 [Salmonella enterica subsp. enterica]|nr:hypothetical protein KCP69_05585 [Salmonella enterica subsp. enterica]